MGRVIKATLVALLVNSATANLHFKFVQPTCDLANVEHPGCLRGQTCQPDGVCQPDEGHFKRHAEHQGPAPPIVHRRDGKCGKNNGGAFCDVNPGSTYGPCCSSYGYCGRTNVHCSVAEGCDRKYGVCSEAAANKPVKATRQARPTSGEPIMGRPTNLVVAAAAGPETTDGHCGAQNKNAICGNWPQGGCCSMYGFCGNTTAHCGDGCQSGPCLKEPGPAAPGPRPAPANQNPGHFEVVGDSGVPAMHAGLLPNGKVVFLDKVENFTKLTLPNGQFAYSSEYDPATNNVVPLAYKTNAFCAGGIFLADGTFVSLGGNFPLPDIDPTVGDGLRGIRLLKRSRTDESLDGQDWIEDVGQMDTARWYPSAQIMPDGTIFVASGSINGLDPTVKENNNPTYEVLTRNGEPMTGSIPMDILVKTQPYYMYPFIHLLRDGSLFVFSSKSSELFNLGTNSTTRRFKDLPGDYRTYPNTGSSVMLPLSSANNWEPEVYVCGGGAYQDITSPTDPSCGRIAPLAENAEWEMDSMPEGRGMVEGVLLPDGTVAWLNGANQGAQGFLIAKDPTLDLLLMDPTKPLGERWMVDAKSEIPRLYHSVALLLLDGTIMVTGSNPVEMPILEPTAESPFITDFRVEIYTPPYLRGENANKRPANLELSKHTVSASSGADSLTASFTVPAGAEQVKASLVYGGFVTHSVHMGQRMLYLDTDGWQAGATEQQIEIKAPPSAAVAPPGPYMLFVVVDGVPSIAQTVMVE